MGGDEERKRSEGEWAASEGTRIWGSGSSEILVKILSREDARV
jgi:hypothetical protein